MSSNYSANQYENGYKPQKLQIWCAPKNYKEQRPTARTGCTTFTADDQGHLLPGIKRGSAWPDFKGTWELPSRIPARCINPTSRSVDGLKRLEAWRIDPQCTARSQTQEGAKMAASLQADGEQQRDASPSRPPTGHTPITSARPPSCSQVPTEEIRPAMEASVANRDEPTPQLRETAVIQATERDRPQSQASQAEERQVS